MRRRGRRPEASPGMPQMDKRLNVVSLRKKIEELDGTDFVTRRVRLGANGHSLRLQENGKVARKGGRIARKINDFGRLQFSESCGGCLPQSRTRWIENNQIRLFVKFLQEFF